MQSVRVLEVVVGARRSTLITIDGLNTASTTAKHSGSISRISITGLHSGVGVTRSTLIALGSLFGSHCLKLERGGQSDQQFNAGMNRHLMNYPHVTHHTRERA
jgi:hypothetical protein